MPGIIVIPLVTPVIEGRSDVRFGRINVVTITDAVSELVGGTVEVVGQYVTAGDRRPKTFAPVLPLFGSASDSNPYISGMRLRRQVRSLIGNHEARTAGVYFKFNIDPELNGWIVCGGAEIKYATGGITFADFEASLQDSYLVGTMRTHQSAVRLELEDLRLVTTARDYLKKLYSADFAAYAVTPTVYLPSNASGVQDESGAPVAGTTVGTLDGNVLLVAGRVNDEVLRFEHAENDMLASVPIILDRQGMSPTFTPGGDAAPQATYGWEEAYGPDYPLTAGDVPVLQNGRCRVRWIAANTAFAIDEYVAASGYVERGRVGMYDASSGEFLTLVHASIAAWTEERAVLLLRMQHSLGTADVYLTLQRGWVGPRVEVYARRASGTASPRIRYAPVATAAQTLATQAGTQTGTGSLGLGAQPWLTLKPSSGSGQGMALAVVQDAGLTLATVDETTLYGAIRRAVDVGSSGTPAAYVSAFFGPSSSAYNTVAQILASERMYASRCYPTRVKRD